MNTLSRNKLRKIPPRVIIVFLILAFGITLTGYLSYEIEKKNLKQNIGNNLSAIADLKVRQIATWRNERLGDARVIQGDRIFANHISRWLANPDAVELKPPLVDWMYNLQNYYDYRSILILDTQGKIRLASNQQDAQLGEYAFGLFQQVVQNKQVILSDFHKTEMLGVHLDLLVPILLSNREQSQCIAVVLLRINPYKNLYPLIQSWPTPSTTAETLLIRQEGNQVLFLNELRHRKNTALLLRLPISEARLPAAMAARGIEGIVEGFDYRQVPVLAAVRRIPDSPWFIIAKDDQTEIYALLQRRAVLTTFITGLMLIITGAIVIVWWREQQVQFYLAQYNAELERKALVSHFEYLIKYANDIILLMDDTGKIIEVNDRAVATYGYFREELLGMNIKNLRAPESFSEEKIHIREATQKNGLIYEAIHKRKDGTTFPVEASAREIKVEEEQYLQLIIRDISERKQAEETLRKNEKRLRIEKEFVDNMFNVSADTIFVFEPTTGKAVRWNDAFRRVSGYTDDEIATLKAPDSYYNQEDLIRADSAIQNIVKAGKGTVELTLLTKKGKAVPFEYSAAIVPDKEGVSQWFISIGRDLTDRKRAEEALKESQEKLRLFIEHAPAALAMYDRDMRYLAVSRRWISDFHLHHINLIGKSHYDVFPELTDEIKAIHQRGMNGEVIKSDEAKFERADGSIQWLCWEMLPWKSADGSIGGIIIFNEDITERKLAEKTLQDSEEKYRSLFINMNEGVAIHQLIYDDQHHPIDYILLDINPKYEAITGITLKQAIGHRASIISQNNQVPYLDIYSEVVRSGKPVRFGAYFEPMNKHFDISAISFGENRFATIFTDITDRKKAEIALIRSHERIRKFIDSSIIGVVIAAPDGKVTEANDYYLRTIGYTREEFEKGLVDWRTITPQEWIPADEQAIAELRARGVCTPYEKEYIRRDGTKVSVFLSDTMLPGPEEQIAAFVLDITERKRIENEIAMSKNFLERIIDLSPFAMWISDDKGILLRANQALREALNVTDKQIIGRYNVFEDQNLIELGVMPQIESVFHKGIPTRFSIPWQASKGGRDSFEGARDLFIDVSMFPIKNNANKVCNVVCQWIDITNLKFTEESLRDKLNRLQLLKMFYETLALSLDLKQVFQKVYDLIPKYLKVDRASLFLYDENMKGLISDHLIGVERPGQVSDSAPQPIGYSISGKCFQDAKPIVINDCSQTDLIPQKYIDLLKLKSTVAVPIISKQKVIGVLRIDDCIQRNRFKEADIELYSMIAEQLGIIIENAWLFTERKQAEEALKNTAERLNEAQSIAHIGSWELDLITNVLTWSDEIYRIFEIDPNKFGASYVAFLAAIHPDDRQAVDFAYTNSLKTHTPYTIDHRLLFPNGRIKYIHEQCETFYENNQPIRSLGTIQDITERKQAEEEVRKLNTELEQRVKDRTAELESVNKELEAFSYSVSHDLRAPLRSIAGFSNIILEDYAVKLDDEGKDYLQRIIASTERMGQLIDDMLTLSRVTRKEMVEEEVDLSKLAESIVSELQTHEPERSIEFRCTPDLKVVGDPVLLTQLLENLLENAVKFTKNQESAKIELGKIEQQGQAMYFVRDNGAGFDMQYIHKLFQPFQRLHRVEDFPGTGVGLATVRRIIARHKGRIWAEGQVDHGATFYFTL
ncbi:MAG: PAS domain S-box protein [bacterium]